MMQPVHRIDDLNASADQGRVVFDYSKAVWSLGMGLMGLVFALPTASLDAVLLFFGLTYITLLLGHSVGMHRLMIHRTFKCHKWLEKTLIYIGVLVGFSGPNRIIRTHDIRDWAQRQPKCHDFFCHRRSWFRDLWWQLTHRFVFDSPPTLVIEDHFAHDGFYQFLDRTWRWHQIGLAIILYLIGGWAWVVWGICLRVFVSISGHWFITYWCHDPGNRRKIYGRWRVVSAGVQASNLPGLGLLTYGECWHNNHHAFPESARIGLEPGQIDPGWIVIKALADLGWVWDIGTPRSQTEREDLICIHLEKKASV